MHGDEAHHHYNNTCCIWLTTAPAGRGNKMCISLCLRELTQCKEDSLPSSNFLAVIYLPHSFCNLWVVWENSFRLRLRRLPAEAEKSQRSVFVLSGVLLGGSVVFCAPQERENKAEYILLHSTNEICVNKPLSAAHPYPVNIQHINTHSFGRNHWGGEIIWNITIYLPAAGLCLETLTFHL